jgi:hypothetical protein
MGDSWSYETGLPDWSLPPDGVEGPTEATEESDPLAAEVAKLDLEDDVKKGDDVKAGAKKEEEAVETVADKA